MRKDTINPITSEVIDQLSEIGFGEDEINTIRMVHELKTRAYKIDIGKIINQIAFRNLSEGIGETFEKNSWSDGDFFDIVEKHRNERKE